MKIVTSFLLVNSVSVWKNFTLHDSYIIIADSYMALAAITVAKI